MAPQASPNQSHAKAKKCQGNPIKSRGVLKKIKANSKISQANSKNSYFDSKMSQASSKKIQAKPRKSHAKQKFPLLELPLELQIMVYINLNDFDLMALGQTSKLLNEIMSLHGTEIVRNIIKAEYRTDHVSAQHTWSPPPPPAENAVVPAHDGIKNSPMAILPHQALSSLLNTAEKLVQQRFFPTVVERPEWRLRRSARLDGNPEVTARIRNNAGRKLHCFRVLVQCLSVEAKWCYFRQCQTIVKLPTLLTEQLLCAVWENNPRGRLGRPKVWWIYRKSCPKRTWDVEEFETLKRFLSYISCYYPGTLHQLLEGRAWSSGLWALRTAGVADGDERTFLREQV